jgi:predicted ATP-grasp superfamily ATP-dependent carboligase
LSHASRPLAGASRYAAAVEVVPDPLTEPAAFVDAAAGIVQRWAIRVVMPVAEQSHLAILPARDRFAPAIVTAGSAESFRELSSKDAVLRAADRLSIPVPRQLEIATRDAIPNEIDPALFPGVLKPAHSVQAGALFRVMYAEDVSAARRTLDALPASAFPLLVQQRIVGQGTGIFVLVWNGRLVAAFAHRRLREQPPSGGASVYCESIPMDEDLLARSLALLNAFQWQGVAMVEYKRERTTGVPYIMEVNARFWGSLQLAIDAGVDFPVLLARAALGEPDRVPPAYRAGARLRSWWADVDHLLVRMRHSAGRLALPVDAPSRWRVVAEFLRWGRRDRMETFRADDAGPFLVDTQQWIASRLPQRLRRANRQR